jgi:hypothetical protein
MFYIIVDPELTPAGRQTTKLKQLQQTDIQYIAKNKLVTPVSQAHLAKRLARN